MIPKCCIPELILPLGLVVSIVILRQGFGLLAGAWGDLTDAGVSPRTQQSLAKVLAPLIKNPSSNANGADSLPLPPLLSVQRLRARHAGSLMFVDLIAEVPGFITISQASALEAKIENTLKAARKEITEVRVTFRSAEPKINKQS